jgi:thioredoxin 1
MSETREPVQYEVEVTPEEARQGTTRLLSRNGKRVEAKIPPGVNQGRLVKLTGALQITDRHPGDILILVRIKSDQTPEEELAAPGVVEVTDGNFGDEVLKSRLPVVVDFWAPWCGPCRTMAPVMDRAAQRYRERFKFCKINVDENPQMAGRFQAMSIPLLIFFRGGQEIDRSVGAIPENQLLFKLDSLS